MGMCPHEVTHVAQIVLFLDEPGCSQKIYSLDIHLLFGFNFVSILKFRLFLFIIRNYTEKFGKFCLHQSHTSRWNAPMEKKDSSYKFPLLQFYNKSKSKSKSKSKLVKCLKQYEPKEFSL